MGEIHSNASRVLVWLSGSDHQPVEALLASRYDVLGTQAYYDEITTSLGLLDRPYFSRIWLVQEVALSRACRVLYRSDGTTSELDLRSVLWPLEGGSIDPSKLIHSLNEKAPLLRQMWLRLQTDWTYDSAILNLHKGTVKVTQILLDGRNLKSTEPRGKIFAMQDMLGRIGIESVNGVDPK